MIAPTLAAQLEAELQQHRKYIVNGIRSHLEHGDDIDQTTFNQTAESGDEAVADLINDTEIAQFGNELAELQKIDAALSRIKAGTYGSCIACGTDIAPQRLQVQPAAARCLACQVELEAEHQRGIASGTSL